MIDGKDIITTEDLLKSVKETKSISSTLKDKIKEIKSTIDKIDIKPASKEDSPSQDIDKYDVVKGISIFGQVERTRGR